MGKSILVLIAALLPALFPVGAGAYVELGSTIARDCRQARDPKRCAARLEARSACRDQPGPARQRCLAALAAPPNCDRAEQPARCAALAAARAACHKKSGAEYRRCMKIRVPAWRSYQAG